MFNLQSGIHRKRFPSPLTPAQQKRAKSIQNSLSTKTFKPQFGPGEGRHTKDVTGLMVDNLNSTVVSCGLDGKVKFWDFTSGTLRHELDWHPIASITGLRYQRSSGLIALTCDDLSIRVVDLETRKLVRELLGCIGQITDFCFSNDGRWIIAASTDSVIRVWDLPTGHLIDAVRMESACTALAFAPNGEFLATAHADSIGVNIWTNRTLFTNVPTKHILDEEVATTSLPTTSGEGGESLLADAYEEVDEDQEKELGKDIAPPTMDQLDATMTTLSLVPRSRWQTLLHLDVIAARNKPIEAPKAPERAPFFLPSLENLKPTNGKVAANSATPAVTVSNEERSRISTLQRRTNERPFSELLHAAAANGDHEAFIEYLKTLPPSAADIEIRSLSPVVGPNEYGAFIGALSARLRQRRDYEVVQAWMAVFLRIHGEAAVRDKESRGLLLKWRELQAEEGKRLAGLVGYCGGVIGFLRTAR